MLCGSPSCTDAQHSPLERTGSSGWAHCDKSPQAPVNKTFKLGSQACLSNHVTAHCPYPCWLKQSFKKFPSILERFAQSYKRLIRIWDHLCLQASPHSLGVWRPGHWPAARPGGCPLGSSCPCSCLCYSVWRLRSRLSCMLSCTWGEIFVNRRFMLKFQ